MDSDGESALIDSNPKIRAGQIRWKKVRDQKISNALSRLQHACECSETNCTNVDCDEMKSLVVHCKVCNRRPKKTCRLCEQLLTMCIYHAKRSNDCVSDRCSIPFCAKLKHVMMLKRKSLRKRLKALYREDGMSAETGGSQSFWDMPSTSTSHVDEQPPETIILDDSESELIESEPRDLSHVQRQTPDDQPLPQRIEIDDEASNPSSTQQHVEQDSPLSPEPENVTEPDSTDSPHPEQHSPLPEQHSPLPSENTASGDDNAVERRSASGEETDGQGSSQLRLRLNQLMASWKHPLGRMCTGARGPWHNPLFHHSSLQPVTTRAPASSSSNYMPSAGDAVHQLKSLLHAHKCLTDETRGAVGGWPCFESNCGFWKNVLKHLDDCTVAECSAYCNSSKSLLKHWQTCIYGDCQLCSSIRRCSTIMQGLTLQGSSFNRGVTPADSYRLARKRVLLRMYRESSQSTANSERLLGHIFQLRSVGEEEEELLPSNVTIIQINGKQERERRRLHPPHE